MLLAGGERCHHAVHATPSAPGKNLVPMLTQFGRRPVTPGRRTYHSSHGIDGARKT